MTKWLGAIPGSIVIALTSFFEELNSVTNWCTHFFLFKTISQRTHTFKYRNYYNPQRWYHSSPTFSMFSSQMFVLIWSNVSSIERYTANKIECDFSQSDHLLKNCWQTCLENCCKMSRNVLIPVGWDFAVKNHQRLCLQNVCNVCKVPGKSLRDCSLNSWKTNVWILSVESL